MPQGSDDTGLDLEREIEILSALIRIEDGDPNCDEDYLNVLVQVFDGLVLMQEE